MIAIIIVSIYLASVLLCFYLNKYGFKKGLVKGIIPMVWVIPILNIFLSIIILFIMLVELSKSQNSRLNSEYWKNKWK